MASTYVNDLRLNEMATGDASGTWGTTTNTNLELISEKFGSGSEALSVPQPLLWQTAQVMLFALWR